MKKLMMILIILLVIEPVRIEANSERGETYLQFHLTSNNKYNYEVKVSNGGCIKDGNQEIRAGSIEYKLSVGEKKSFKIISDIGYEIEKIKNNGKEIDIRNGEIEITGVSANSKLEIRFKKKEKEISKKEPAGISNNTERKPDTRGNASQVINRKRKISNIKTSDESSLKKYILMLLTGLMMMILLKKKHIKR